MSHQQAAAGGSDQRISAWSQAEYTAAQRLHGMQAARDSVRDGGPRHALPGTGDPCRLRCHLPLISSRLLRVFWSHGDAEHDLPEQLVASTGSGRSRVGARISEL